MGRVNKFKRVQRRLRVEDVYPIQHNNRCDCGCGRKLRGRKRRWATKSCAAKVGIRVQIIKGNYKVIRREIFKRDKGKCSVCKKTFAWNQWQADHIKPVALGGGGCDLDGFQTLCKNCHRVKTKKDLIDIKKLKNSRITKK